MKRSDRRSRAGFWQNLLHIWTQTLCSKWSHNSVTSTTLDLLVAQSNLRRQETSPSTIFKPVLTDCNLEQSKVSDRYSTTFLRYRNEFLFVPTVSADFDAFRFCGLPASDISQNVLQALPGANVKSPFAKSV